MPLDSSLLQKLDFWVHELFPACVKMLQSQASHRPMTFLDILFSRQELLLFSGPLKSQPCCPHTLWGKQLSEVNSWEQMSQRQDGMELSGPISQAFHSAWDQLHSWLYFGNWGKIACVEKYSGSSKAKTTLALEKWSGESRRWGWWLDQSRQQESKPSPLAKQRLSRVYCKKGRHSRGLIAGRM